MVKDRKELEAEARTALLRLWARMPEDQQQIDIPILADWADTIQREAVAEERKSLRDLVLVSRNDFPLGGMMCDKILRALDARSKP